MLNFRALSLEELSSIQDLEKAHLGKTLNEIDLSMREWHAPWRKESLEYYLPKGWCAGAWLNDALRAYFLGQPLLFWNGETQSLWIEHVFASSEQELKAILDISIRYARDKHLQRVVYSSVVASSFKEVLQALGARESKGGFWEILTTKR